MFTSFTHFINPTTIHYHEYSMKKLIVYTMTQLDKTRKQQPNKKQTKDNDIKNFLIQNKVKISYKNS